MDSKRQENVKWAGRSSVSSRLRLRFTALLLAGAFVTFGAAGGGINTTRDGVAIEGFDAVAYHQDQMATRGAKEHSLVWNGATWYFASVENRDLFAESPETYAPRYGGYCAWAVSKGSLAKVNPQAWTLHEGELYLNFSLGIRRTWRRDIPGNIIKADKNWPSLMDDR